MTYLQQALAQQRMTRRPDEDFGISEEGHAPALTVHIPPDTVWVFPWASFVSARSDQVSRREQVVLIYPRNAVLIRGRNLDRIMAAVGALRLESIRARIDGAGAEQVTADQTVITEIVVSEPEIGLALDAPA
jgi:hypothetical protein